MNVRHPMGVLYSFSIKKFFFDKMNLRLFYFHVATCFPQGFSNELFYMFFMYVFNFL